MDASFEHWPPRLQYLAIRRSKKPISQWGLQNFPTTLVSLYLWGNSAEEDDVTSGTQLSHILPRKLEVCDCEVLVSLGEKEEDSSWGNLLTSLIIFDCKKLERCSCPNNIEKLNMDCSPITFVAFPEGGCQKLKSLRIWECNELVGKELEKMFLSTSMPMLQDV
nr:hypothetical protein [Tanacetum cinerariifolium]